MQGVIFMGLQASGKSSFYLQQFYDTHIRLNLDMLKTRHREQLLFRACLTAKQPLVIDNTNPTLEERQRYIPALQQQQFAIIGYYFSANLQQSLARNQQRSGKACVPEAAIRATYAKLQRPSYQEGFTQLYYVQLNQGQFTVNAWCSDEV